MSFLCYVSKVLKRAFLYYVLILFATNRMFTAFKNYSDFEDRLGKILNYFNLSEDLIFWDSKSNNVREWTFKGFLISLMVFAGFATLGCRCCQFISGILTIFVAFLYYDPIPNFKKAIESNDIKQFLPDIEFLLFITLGLAMIANSFNCTCCNKKEQKKDESKEEKVEENKVEEENKKEPAPKTKNSSKSHKKKE